ncbi:glycosyl transferase [Pullulanibacillus camelliae]|uniref:Glycosyl transferase n=1 Tax=Pullulanibacillus camelliae TaxID=1707096 RepID=A0A8J2YNS7_9BACL|nr:glycosyltransferase [Pullulanibacillus camelliae]GGE56168.1 glycosyl transferase [Pullulanibacillus camelliae]
MRILHLIGGKEEGGSMSHLLPLMDQFDKENVFLSVFDHGVLPERAEELGVKVFYLQQHSRYDLSVIRRLKEIMESQQIDILHTHGPRANVFAYLLKKTYAFTWVTTIHSDPRLDFMGCGIKGWMFTRVHLKVLKAADHYFAISQRFRDIVNQMGVEESHITTIYNGVIFYGAVKRKITRHELGISNSDFVIVTVGRLHPVKGHCYLLKALHEIIEEAGKTNIKCVIVGDGGEEASLKQLAQELHIEKHVLFVGKQKDVQPFYSLADVKILPSLSESFPLVVLEAAKAHVPVIATDVGGVNELITDRSLGWVVPPKHEKALVQAITDAMHLKECGQLSRIGDNLFRKASRQYSLHRLVDKINQTYRQLTLDKKLKQCKPTV